MWLRPRKKCNTADFQKNKRGVMRAKAFLKNRTRFEEGLRELMRR
jgi:hypothetical protein